MTISSLFYVIAILGTVVMAVLGLALARGNLRPSHLVKRIQQDSSPEKRRSSVAIKVRPWRVAIDARPMIGEPLEGSQTSRVFGIGHYLRSLVEELGDAETDIQFVLWSSAAKHDTPEWFDTLVRSHSNFSAVHIRLPNKVIDRAAYWSRLKFLTGFVGPIDVSWEANYFPLKPGDAYSICTVHDLSFQNRDFSRRAYNELSALHAGLADKITTVSHASKAKILSTLEEVSDKQVEVVYGAAASVFDHIPTAEHFSFARDAYRLPPSYFLSVGEAAARKNLPNLIRAFQIVRLKAPDTFLLMVGLLPVELDELLKQTGEDFDRTNVNVLGYVPQTDLPSLYHGSTALVYPSFDEGFGLPIVEAMRMAGLVVASDIPASREIGGEAAIFVSPHRAEAIAAGMMEAQAMSPSLRRDRADAGLTISLRFSWRESSRKMLGLFEEGFRTKNRVGS